MNNIVVIGAGIGGLTAAALLAKSGLNVTVLEAHVYSGGTAGTFYHQGYRFDVGATVAGGFYPDGPMDRLAKAVGIKHWPGRLDESSMLVRLPNGKSIHRWADQRRFSEYQNAFGSSSLDFWNWQEKTADLLWDLALKNPSWPPQSLSDLARLIKQSVEWSGVDFPQRMQPGLIADAFSSVQSHLKDASEDLRLFVDAQLLIAAQTTSKYANALYGASALDLPRRGVMHLEGGMGAIAEALVQSVRTNGGEVLYRKEVTRAVVEKNRIVAVETSRGEHYPADLVIANLTPWNIRRLFSDSALAKLRNLPETPQSGWGAFVVYVGVDQAALPEDMPLHQQLIAREPLGEGNSIFLSVSPDWDIRRAPVGKRAITISTHTHLGPWWDLFQNNRFGYESTKMMYLERIMRLADEAIPGLSDATELLLPGTPITFSRFTRRERGWVGGFPQVNLFQSRGPRLSPNLWMVGDSIFPGQSTAAVALGGMRVAQDILAGFQNMAEYTPHNPRMITQRAAETVSSE